MSQATTWSVPLVGPATPTALTQRIDDSLDALLSGHSGSARPAYAVAGTEWQDTSVAGIVKCYHYDGSIDRLLWILNTSTNSVTWGNPSSEAYRGYIRGLTISNNTSDATNDIDIAPGSAGSDGASSYLMVLASSITKRLDAAWAVGTNQGGLDTGSVTNGTYHAWLIERSDTGVKDVLFSLSATTPTMPANYDRKAYLWPVVRASGANLGFRHIGKRFLLASPVTIRSSTSGVTDALVTCVAPTGIRVRPILSLQFGQNAAGAGQNILGDGDAATAAFSVQQVNASSIDATVVDQFYTNTSAQIRFSTSNVAGAPTSNVLNSLGWIVDRDAL